MIKIGIVIRSKFTDGSFFVASSIKGIKSFNPDSIIHIGFSESYGDKYSYQSIKSTKNGYILKVKEIASLEAVIDIKEKAVFIEENDIAYEDKTERTSTDSYTVIDKSSDSVLGILIETLSLPGNDVLIVKADEKEYLIPDIPDIVKNIDHERKIIEIEPIEGLLDL